MLHWRGTVCLSPWSFKDTLSSPCIVFCHPSHVAFPGPCLAFFLVSSLCWIYIPVWRGLPLFPADVFCRTSAALSPQVVCCHRHLAQSLRSSQTVAFPQLWLPAANWSSNFSSRFYILFGKTFLFLFQAFLAASGERFLVSLFLFWGRDFQARAALPSRGRGAWGSLSLRSD